MKTYDVVGFALKDGSAICPGCAQQYYPGEYAAETLEPIFAGSEWDCCPTCDICLGKIEEVSLPESTCG